MKQEVRITMTIEADANLSKEDIDFFIRHRMQGLELTAPIKIMEEAEIYGNEDPPGESTTLINPQSYRESVHHFMYFLFNFPHKFWEKAFGESGHLQDHITAKFLDMYEKHGPTLGTVKFFMELDNNRRNQLMDWVRENYTGYKMKP